MAGVAIYFIASFFLLHRDEPWSMHVD